MIIQLTLKNLVHGRARHAIARTVDQPIAAMAIIHGLGEHSGRYLHMMEYLARQNISTLAIDLEGHGQSEGKQGVCRNYDYMQADTTLALSEIRKLNPDVPIFLYGHSMGGGLVLNYGLKKAPEIAGYIISAPLIRPAEPVPGPLRVIVKMLRKIAPNMTLSSDIDGTKISTLQTEQAAYEQDPHNHGKMGVGLAADIVEGGEWIADNANKWRAPLLLMHAKGDRLTQFEATEAFSKTAQNCTFMALENCEHEMHNDVTRDHVYEAMANVMSGK